MAGVEVLFLSRQDIDALELGLQDVLDAVEVGLAAHGNKKVIMPSKDHLVLDFPEKLFNILKGYVEPVNAAGVKVIGDFQNRGLVVERHDFRARHDRHLAKGVERLDRGIDIPVRVGMRIGGPDHGVGPADQRP